MHLAKSFMQLFRTKFNNQFVPKQYNTGEEALPVGRSIRPVKGLADVPAEQSTG
jgi:hypothetical protein